MKTMPWTLLCSTILIGAAHAQQPAADESKTRVGAFLASKGKMLVKDFYALGKVNTVTFDAVVVSEPGHEDSKIRGLRIDVSESGSRLERSHTSFLDVEEGESLVSALAYMEKLAADWATASREPYTEVTFDTKGEFRIGFYYQIKQKAFVSSGSIGAVTAFLDMGDLPKVRVIIEHGLAKLREH
jgi:hypothetical protein